MAQRGGPQREGDTPSIRLHDLQLDYVRAQFSGSDREALETIHAAVRLSSHVIERDPRQFASQMLGRLLSDRSPRVQKLMRSVAKYWATPWLKPKTASLIAPGGPLVRVLAGHSGWVRAVAVTPDGKRPVSASADETLKVWDLESGKVLRTFAGHGSDVFAVAVTPDGKRAVSASSDDTLKVWDLASGRELQTLAGHTKGVIEVAVTADGKRAVSASWDKTLNMWDLASGKRLGTKELRTLPTETEWFQGLPVAVTADGKRAVLSSGDGTLKVWDPGSGEELQTLAGHSEWVSWLAMTMDGKRAVSASYDKTLKVWDLDGGKELQTLAGHSDRVNWVAVTADGKRAVSASDDKTLKVWDLASGKVIAAFTADDPLLSCATGADGRVIVAGDASGRVHFLSLVLKGGSR